MYLVSLVSCYPHVLSDTLLLLDKFSFRSPHVMDVLIVDVAICDAIFPSESKPKKKCSCVQLNLSSRLFLQVCYSNPLFPNYISKHTMFLSHCSPFLNCFQIILVQHHNV
jgi:hypothetical protein